MLRVTDVKISVEPAEEPVSTAEAKLHLRVDVADDDALIASLVTVARVYCEQVARRAFVTRTYTADLWRWHSPIELPYPPLAAVTSIVYTGADGVEATLANTVYGVDTQRTPGLIYLAQDQEWPSTSLRDYAPIRLTYTAGYGAAADVPDTYKAAIKLMLGHLYENREAVIAQQGITMGTLPLALDALLLTDRGHW